MLIEILVFFYFNIVELKFYLNWKSFDIEFLFVLKCYYLSTQYSLIINIEIIAVTHYRNWNMSSYMQIGRFNSVLIFFVYLYLVLNIIYYSSTIYILLLQYCMYSISPVLSYRTLESTPKTDLILNFQYGPVK